MARTSVAVASLLAVFAFVLVQNSEALHCWVCSSDADPACGDPFNMTRHYLVTDCDRDRAHTSYLKSPAVCRKYKHKTHKGSDEEIVVRSCAWSSSDVAEGPCSPNSLHFAQHLVSCSICTTDECNAATGLQAFSVLVSLALALTVAKLV